MGHLCLFTRMLCLVEPSSTAVFLRRPCRAVEEGGSRYCAVVFLTSQGQYQSIIVYILYAVHSCTRLLAVLC